MLVRLTKKSEPVDLTSNEFINLVKTGKITIKSLIKNEFIAYGKWISVDNYKPFHQASPTSYPIGPHVPNIKLRVRKKITEEERREADRLSRERIEKYLELVPIKNLFDKSLGLCAISRLTIRPSFDPESAITLLFDQESIYVEIVKGNTSIWYLRETKTFDFKVKKSSEKLSYTCKANLFKSPEYFISIAKKAVSCSSPVLDGISYRHEVISNEVNINDQWYNPCARNHPTQTNLVLLYCNIMDDILNG